MNKPPRSRTGPEGVDRLLSDPEHALGVLCRHARDLARLESLLAGCTDPDTANRFQVANVRQDRVVLVTPTAAWATRLRMQAPQMTRCLQGAGFGHLQHIDIRVAPLVRDPPERRKRRHLSPAAEQAMDQIRRLARR